MEFDFNLSDKKGTGIDKSVIEKIFDYKKLSELSENGFIIGGSMALRLYGYSIARYIDEIDLITTNEQLSDPNYLNYFNGLEDIKEGSHINDSKHCFVGGSGELYDILACSEKCGIKYVTKYIDGFAIKLQDEEQIWAKKKEYALNGFGKHEFDLLVNKIITKNEFDLLAMNRKKALCIDDLPF